MEEHTKSYQNEQARPQVGLSKIPPGLPQDTPRLWLAKVPGGYHVRRDDRYINVTPDMVDDAVFMLCLDVLEREEE